jgi:hypothetical protein
MSDNTFCLDADEDFRISSCYLCGRTRTVAQPSAKRVRRHQQLAIRSLQRGGVYNRVIQSAVRSGTPQRLCDVTGGPDRRERLLVLVPVVLDRGGLRGFPRRPGLSEPLMLGICNDDRPIRELDLVAGAAQHDVRRGNHPRRFTVGVGSGVSTFSALPTPGLAAMMII